MNSVFSPVVKSLLVVLLATLATTSMAEEKKADSAPPKIDPAKGGTLFSDGDNARGIPACVSCHGANGNSTIAVNPKRPGQHEA